MTSYTLTRFSAVHPVVMTVPTQQKKLSAPERQEQLSRLARGALDYSSGFSGIRLGKVTKDQHGVPKPVNGIYWSLSHTEECVAAVVAPVPVGIDLEKIANFSPLLQQQIADEREWSLVTSVTPQVFYSFWTAKEAVLKAVGIGLQGLKECRVVKFTEKGQIALRYQSSRWSVEVNSFYQDHLAALTHTPLPVHWHYLQGPNSPWLFSSLE